MKLLLTACLLLASFASAFGAGPKVLVIESYHSEYAWDASYLDGLRKGFGGHVQLPTFEMNTKRVPKSMYQKQADLAWERYLAEKPDLVILGDDNALKFLGAKFVETTTPVVYLGINNDPDSYVPRGKNLTGILERPLFDFNIRTISSLLKPQPKKMLVLFDHGTTSNAAVSEAFQGKPRLQVGDVMVELRMVGNWDLWQTTIAQAKESGFDAIIVGLYHTLVDRVGKNVPAEEVLAWTSANTPLPPFGFWDFSVGADKTIGGFVLSGEEQGKAAAAIAQRILSGTPPGSIEPVVGKEGAFVFNQGMLKRFGIELPDKIRQKSHWVD